MADMAKIMSVVREYSDARLADVLAGKDMSVPQFAAMTEAMGRKQLRQAVDGQQAMQQAQQPSVKDQLLAEQQAEQAQMGGIASLPAPNMEAMGEGMAGGGIIAFEEGGDVPGFYKGGDVWAAQRAREEDPEVFMSKAWFKKNFEGDVADRNAKRAADIAQQQKLNAQEAEGFGEPKARSEEDPFGVADTRSFAELKGPGVSEPPIEPAAAPANKTDAAATAVTPIVPPKGRENPFVGLTTDQVDFNKLKSQGMGEGLMKAAAGLLSKPTFAAGLGAGISALADSGMASRKEIAGLRKDAQEYNLLRMKASEAFEQGREDLAYKYSKMAQDKELGLAQISKMGQSGELNLLKALQRPGEDLNTTFARTKAAGYAPKSRAELEKAWLAMKPGARLTNYNNDVEKYIEEQTRISQGLLGGGADGSDGIQFIGKKPS
jgi:hypothetical protein